MDYSKTLAFTGTGVVVGGTIISDQWIVLGAIVLVAIGALLIRASFRRNKKAQEK
jgi:hypothetical protein